MSVGKYDCQNRLWHQWRVRQPMVGKKKNKTQKKQINREGPACCLPACLPAVEWWLPSGRQPYISDSNEICFMRGQNTSIGFRVLFMCCVDARLAVGSEVFQPNHKNIGWQYLFCLLGISGHCSAFITGASQQLVMTQYPQPLKLPFLLLFLQSVQLPSSLPSFPPFLSSDLGK